MFRSMDFRGVTSMNISNFKKYKHVRVMMRDVYYRAYFFYTSFCSFVLPDRLAVAFFGLFCLDYFVFYWHAEQPTKAFSRATAFYDFCHSDLKHHGPFLPFVLPFLLATVYFTSGI